MAVAGRPYLRTAWARILYERMIRDEEIKSCDKSQWYRCDLDQLTPELGDRFLQSHLDGESQAFLDSCYARGDWILTQVYHSLAKAVLCWFMTQTSINGLLGRGSMFVFSRLQFTNLLSVDLNWRAENLLDLGAGDGKITEIMAPFFKEVDVTEISGVMRNVLSKKGFRVVDVEDWVKSNITYDMIACLNLLDRCDKPISLLRNIKVKLKPNGLLLVAIVLPLKQYVEVGNSDHMPSEILPVSGSTFEDHLTSLQQTVFRPLGFEVVKWTKLPYLCEGDIEQSFYLFYDAVLVLKVTSQPESDQNTV